MTRKQSDNHAYLPRWLAVGFVMSLTACAAPSEWRDSVRESIDTTMQESKKSAKPVPAEISQALLPPIEIKLPDGKVPTRTAFRPYGEQRLGAGRIHGFG